MNPSRQRIAIIGSGISGLVAAHTLAEAHEVTLFEKDARLGGHTETHDIEVKGRHYAIDTGFIVFNDWTYPEFIRLMSSLGVDSQESHMSFSVKCELTGLEYNGTSLNALFAQRSNLFSPKFYRMIKDILRFNRDAPQLLDNPHSTLTLGEYLELGRYGALFRNYYIIPMGAAIWSSHPAQMLDFPAVFFVRFFKNHGMLSVDQRPTWRVIRGGSSTYIPALTERFKQGIRLNAEIEGVLRHEDHVEIRFKNGDIQTFDQIVMACHSNQALKLLKDPSPEELDILGAMRYQVNETVLHTDTRMLPKRPLAWAAWNYHLPKMPLDRVAVTYNMNILQGIESDTTFCVTLNHLHDIDPKRILKQISYEHPVFDQAAVNAQERFHEVSGVRRTHFAGAYWGFGFHEDGVKSGLRAAQDILKPAHE